MIADGMTAAGERRWAARFSSVARHYERRVAKVLAYGPKAHWAEVEQRRREAAEIERKVKYWRRASARAADRARELRLIEAARESLSDGADTLSGESAR